MLSPKQTLSHPLFTYYCSNCYVLLHQTRELLPPRYLVQKIVNCPECNQPLEDTLTYRQTYKPDTEPQTTHLQIPPQQETTPPPIFQTATSLLGLTTGITRIDSLLGGLKERTHLLLLGQLSNTLAERLCLRSLLPRDNGGLETNPIFIDAGNCSDPYLYAHYARRHHIEPKKALQRVLTSRAFTIYQLTNLITKELPQILRQYQTKLIIIADLLSMFDGPQLDRQESERNVEEIGRSIQSIRDEQNLLIITTTTRKEDLAKLLLKRADIALEIEPEKNQSATVTLHKHPKQQPSTQTLRQHELLKVTAPRKTPKEVTAYG